MIYSRAYEWKLQALQGAFKSEASAVCFRSFVLYNDEDHARSIHFFIHNLKYTVNDPLTLG